MKRYSKKWRAGAWILLVLFLISLVSIIFLSGCGTQRKATSDMWALIRLPDGNTVHVRVVDYIVHSTSATIFTKDRMYKTSFNNVCLVQDLEVDDD